MRMDLSADIMRTLRRGQFDLSDVKTAQGDIFDWLTAEFPGHEVKRQYQVWHGAIADVWLDGVVIQIDLVQPHPRPLFRQIDELAMGWACKAIIVATNRTISLPKVLRSKPVAIFKLGAS